MHPPKHSLFHTLNLENSNFENSEYDNTIIKNSKLATSNFSKTRINQTSFINTQMTGVKFDNSTIIYSDFVSCALYGSSFDNATIINSSFVKTNLIGVDFSKASFSYDAPDEIKNYFFGTLYNSKPITVADTYNITHIDAYNYCALHQDKHTLHICTEAIMSVGITLKSSEVSKVTQFPDTFNPQKYNLIDVSDFIEFLKESVD